MGTIYDNKISNNHFQYRTRYPETATKKKGTSYLQLGY